MNSALFVNIFRFLLLLAVQIIIFNNMNFLGYISPFPYVLFIILYPVNGNKFGLLLAGFFLGIIMDMFSNSGGIHTAACLVLAFYRPYLFKFSFGLIYDRNGVLWVANQPSYDIMVIPRDMKNIDTLEFCQLLDITKEDFIKKIAKAKVYSPRLPSVFLPQLNKKEFAAFQEKMRKFEGFYFQKRSLRDYQVNFGANVFGF